MPFVPAWSHLVSSAGRAGRSTALRVLLFLDSMLSAPLLVSVYTGHTGPPWVLPFFGVFLAVALVATFGAYGYFMIRDPGALRSETFALRSMEIQRGIVGDDRTGARVLEQLPDALDQAEASSQSRLRGPSQ